MVSLNPIHLADRPSSEYHALKLKLNEEFNQKAKIKGLVSYIYYPTCEEKTVGHAKLEIEGTAKGWIWGSREEEKPMARLIRSAEKHLPFFRIFFDVTPNVLKKLREDQTNAKYVSCSRGALMKLSKNGSYSVPFLMTLTPSLSYFYLYAAKYLGSKEIRKIEYYGDPKIYNYLSGALGELFVAWGATILVAELFFKSLGLWSSRASS